MKYLVIDIGGSFTKYAVMDETCEIYERDTIPTPQEGRAELVEVIGELYDQYAKDIDGIAIAAPGIIDSDRGYFYTGGALRYNEDFAMKEALLARCDTKIHIENDGKCAAMAEAAVGCLSDVDNGVVLVLGTMIGGGIIQNRQLYKGSHFAAGEVSFICVNGMENPAAENIWGNRCGGVCLCKRLAALKQMPECEIDGREVFKMVYEGDLDAIRCLDEYTREIALQIFNLQNILDPDRFGIGGGLSVQPLLLEYIQKNLDEIYANFTYIVRKAEVVTCHYLNASNLIGAMQCFLEAEE
ncbi:MAG: ROK family protein [Clostridium sp.]